MASRMNSGGSIDLNRIKIDPRTDEKFSFNLDIVAATAWYDQEASRELSHGRARNSVLTWILLSRTLSDIVVPHVGRWQLSGSLYVFL